MTMIENDLAEDHSEILDKMQALKENYGKILFPT